MEGYWCQFFYNEKRTDTNNPLTLPYEAYFGLTALTASNTEIATIAYARRIRRLQISGPNRLERNRVPDDRLARSRHGQGGAARDTRCFDDLSGELGRPHPAVDLELVGPLGVGVRLGERPQFARGERLAENYGRAGRGLSGQDDVLRGDIDVVAGRGG